MRTKTGVLGICLMTLGTLVVSSTNTKTANAHSSSFKSTSVAVVIHAPANVGAPVASVASVAPLAPVAAIATLAPSNASAEIITPPPADLYLENPKLRRMHPGEISKGMLEAAAKIVHRHYAKPVGTLIEVDVDGKHVIARIERHFHPEGGPVKPWGFHPGVSLFAPR